MKQGLEVCTKLQHLCSFTRPLNEKLAKLGHFLNYLSEMNLSSSNRFNKA